MELWVPGSRLDRVGDQRLNPAWVKALWEAPDATLLSVGSDSSLLVDADGSALWAERPAGGFDPERHFLVGLVEGNPVFACEVDDREDGPAADERAGASNETPAARRVVGRFALAGLADTARDVATTALALVNWHRVAPHCGVCGSLTQVRQAGHVRYCATCERERYPRTDPAVITAVVDAAGRLLLAHNAAWDSNRMSLLAGFVDAGESLEQAVRRECAEEAALELSGVQYVASQPWPFPRSLMVGFSARAATPEFQVDGTEIDRARYFTPAEYDEAIGSGELGPPTSISIASQLIALWRAGDLPLPPAA